MPMNTTQGIPTLAARETLALAELRAIPNPQQRLVVLIGLAPADPPPGLCVEAHRVSGCLSALWIRGTVEAGCCRFESHSDSRIVHAVVAWLCRVYDGCAAEEILGCTSSLVADAGLSALLTRNRRNALARAWEAMQKEVSGVGGQVPGNRTPTPDP